MNISQRAKRIADRLIWRPALLLDSVQAQRKLTTMRFSGLPGWVAPGHWLKNQSQRARCAYRIVEIGEPKAKGIRQLLLESCPVNQIPNDAIVVDFERN